MSIIRSIIASAVLLVLAVPAGEGLPDAEGDHAAIQSQTSTDKGEVQMENFPINQLTEEFAQKTGKFQQKVEAALKDRYGRDFKVSRIDVNPGQSELWLHLYPTNDETLVFAATVEEGMAIHENYVARLRLSEFEQELAEQLATAGFTALVKAGIPGLDTSEIHSTATLNDLLDLEDAPGLLIHLALQDPVADPAGLIKELRIAAKKCSVRTVFYGYVLDREGFSACRKQFRYNPDTTDAIMSGYAPAASFSLAVEAGVCRIFNQRGITIPEVEDDE